MTWQRRRRFCWQVGTWVHIDSKTFCVCGPDRVIEFNLSIGIYKHMRAYIYDYCSFIIRYGIWLLCVIYIDIYSQALIGINIKRPKLYHLCCDPSKEMILWTNTFHPFMVKLIRRLPLLAAELPRLATGRGHRAPTSRTPRLSARSACLL